MWFTVGRYRCREKRTETCQPHSRKAFTSRINKACLAVKENYQWKEIHFKDISISPLFFRKQRHFMCRFCYFRKKELCSLKCQKGRSSFGLCFFSGERLSCHFTGCILQMFSVDVHIDVNTNFYLSTLDSGFLISC